MLGFLNIAMRFDGPYGKQIVSNHKMEGRENSIQLIVPLTLYALYDTEKSFISIIKKYINLTKGHNSLHTIFSRRYIYFIKRDQKELARESGR